MMEIKEALTKTEFKVIEKLANIILHEVYNPMIPAEHTRYFLERFQSEKTIENQVKKENYHYYLLQYKNENVGYLGIQKLDKKTESKQTVYLKRIPLFKNKKESTKLCSSVYYKKIISKTLN